MEHVVAVRTRKHSRQVVPSFKASGAKLQGKWCQASRQVVPSFTASGAKRMMEMETEKCVSCARA
jgi:hypothetical protein